jgi:hypothetical protein
MKAFSDAILKENFASLFKVMTQETKTVCH